jgi:hypothetical protein
MSEPPSCQPVTIGQWRPNPAITTFLVEADAGQVIMVITYTPGQPPVRQTRVGDVVMFDSLSLFIGKGWRNKTSTCEAGRKLLTTMHEAFKHVPAL